VLDYATKKIKNTKALFESLEEREDFGKKK